MFCARPGLLQSTPLTRSCQVRTCADWSIGEIVMGRHAIYAAACLTMARGIAPATVVPSASSSSHHQVFATSSDSHSESPAAGGSSYVRVEAAKAQHNPGTREVRTRGAQENSTVMRRHDNGNAKEPLAMEVAWEGSATVAMTGRIDRRAGSASVSVDPWAAAIESGTQARTSFAVREAIGVWPQMPLPQPDPPPASDESGVKHRLSKSSLGMILVCSGILAVAVLFGFGAQVQSKTTDGKRPSRPAAGAGGKPAGSTAHRLNASAKRGKLNLQAPNGRANGAGEGAIASRAVDTPRAELDVRMAGGRASAVAEMTDRDRQSGRTLPDVRL